MRNHQAVSYYPIFLNIQSKKCVVVGGGEIALRKVKTLLEHGASVEVVSPVFCPELVKISEKGKVKSQTRNYKSQDLKGALLAIAATDDADTNQRIFIDAKKLGVLVNVVDVPQYSDFIVPSSMTRGDITIAVSTSGKSPALARKIRTELENQLGDEYSKVAEIVSETRNQLRQEGITVTSEAWQEVLNLNSLTRLLRQHKDQEAKNALLRKLRRLGQKKP